MPLENLKKIALDNAKKASRDIKITGEERRTINGTELLYMKMEGTIEGAQLIFQGYYYTGRQGMVQVITWTGRNLIDEYRADFEDFLNGFVAN